MTEDTERIAELFSSYRPMNIRRMFSGVGVFTDGLMIALVVDGVVYFKVDDHTIPDFQREGAPFQYRSRNGMRTLKSYWRMPERLYDAPDELAGWARRAAECARRAAATRLKRRSETLTSAKLRN